MKAVAFGEDVRRVVPGEMVTAVVAEGRGEFFDRREATKVVLQP